MGDDGVNAPGLSKSGFLTNSFDSSGGAPFAGLDRAVAEAACEGQRLTVNVIPDADHFYNGLQDTAAHQVAHWLATCGD